MESQADVFWHNFEILRGERSVTELAEKAGIRAGMIRMARHRGQLPGTIYAVSIARALDTTVETLMGPPLPGEARSKSSMTRPTYRLSQKGKRGFSMSIPSTWVSQVGLSAGDPVKVEVDDLSRLVISAPAASQ